MLFLGNTFLGNRFALDPTQTYIPNLNYVRIGSAVFDDIFISSDPGYDLTNQQWDFDTVLWSKFRDSLASGNVEESLKDISSVVIKRRRKDTYDWIPLFEIPVENTDSLKFERFDRYAAGNQEYEYALAFKLADVEGAYNVNSIVPRFDGIFIASRDKIFSSVIEAYTPQIQKNKPSALVNTIDSKYPFVVSHSKNNYYSGSMSGVFVEQKQSGCELDFEQAHRYRHDLLEFLCDGKAKFLKLDDGRMWMIAVVDNPAESQDSDTQKVVTSFAWAEIGGAESAQDLYENGFIDVSAVRRR